MKFVADIHLHSRWSRATSRDLTPENLHAWSMRKGIGVVGSADFTHPEWLAELKEKLVPAEDGLYRLRPDLLDGVEEGVPPSCRREVRFLLSVEISSIYKKAGRTRKVHNVVCLPSFAAVDRLNARLGAIGNLRADGRPILGLDCRDLLEICLEACPEVLFIPAHIWTPHFAVLGAGSGFDSLQACFEDLLPHIYAVETGLSSDPAMNGRLSALDRFALVSNSDAHSPAKLGREATCFDTERTYPAICAALASRDPARFPGTIEFYPEEGKYHLDGHRACGVCWTPARTAAAAGRCPECGGALTVGVLHRVERLADRAEGEGPPVRRAFETLVPLDEVIAACVGVGPKSKRVLSIYHDLLQQLGPELDILRSVPPERIAQAGHPLVAEGVRRGRAGQVHIDPGYDGRFGVVRVFTDAERRRLEGQGSLIAAEAVTGDDVAAAAVVQRLADGDGADRDGDARGRVETLLHAAARVGANPPSGLDEAQRRAAHARGGPVAVVAGPGAGKTRTLTQRIAWLLDAGEAPERIAAVTFTQRAAGQLRQRLEALPGVRGGDVVVGTFHRLALDLTVELGGAPPSIVDEVEARGLLGDVLEAARRASPQTPALPSVAAAQRRISRWKADGLRPFQVAAEPLALVYAGYDERLRACGARDYDDLLLDLLESIRGDADLARRAGRRFGHLLVDEFQDVNAVQYGLVRALAGAGAGLFVIGDPHQAIYGFRGADARTFDRLRADYEATQVFSLSRNYRSRPEIVAAATAVLAAGAEGEALQAAPQAVRPSTGARLQRLTADSDTAEAIAVSRAVAGLVGGTDLPAAAHAGTAGEVWSFADIAVLTRTTTQLDLLETCLARDGIPCRVLGHKAFLEERGARDAVAFFRYALDPARPLRLVEALRTGPFDIGARALAQLTGAAGSPARLEAAIATLPTAAAAQVEALRRAAAGYARRASGEAPAAVLRVWCADFGGDAGCAFDRLLAVAETSPSMAHLLDTLLLGADADVERRGADGQTPGRGRRAEAVTLTTMHAAKGLEFPVVIVCGLEDGLVPLARQGVAMESLAVDPEEERRLFYVALTRAGERAILTHARQRLLHGQRRPMAPSPYLAAIPEDLLLEVRAGGRRDQLSLFPS